MVKSKHLYPVLPTAPPHEDDGVAEQKAAVPSREEFRLAHITRLQDYLQTEVETHDRTRRRYKRAFSTLLLTSSVLGGFGAACGAVSVGTLAGGVTIPLALPLGAMSLGSGLCAAGFSIANKPVARKLEKHERIVSSARSSYETVASLVSKALTDDSVSDGEFNSILAEVERYRVAKKEIRLKTRQAVEADMKKIAIEEGRRLGIQEAQERLSSIQSQSHTHSK